MTPLKKNPDVVDRQISWLKSRVWSAWEADNLEEVVASQERLVGFLRRMGTPTALYKAVHELMCLGFFVELCGDEGMVASLRHLDLAARYCRFRVRLGHPHRLTPQFVYLHAHARSQMGKIGLQLGRFKAALGWADEALDILHGWGPKTGAAQWLLMLNHAVRGEALSELGAGAMAVLKNHEQVLAGFKGFVGSAFGHMATEKAIQSHLRKCPWWIDRLRPEPILRQIQARMERMSGTATGPVRVLAGKLMRECDEWIVEEKPERSRPWLDQKYGGRP